MFGQLEDDRRATQRVACAPMEFELGHNQYGKTEVRMLAVDRNTSRHSFADLNVSITLSGDLEGVHTDGSNANVVATDTQQNTIYAFARQSPVGEIEEFALRLARHFVAEFPTIARARVNIESAAWTRIPVDGEPHAHAFVSAGSDLRVAEVVVDADAGEWVLSGLTDLIVLKTTGSEFTGFIRDGYTLLSDTDDRILSTSVNARWRHGGLLAPGEWDASFAAAREALLARFAEVHSLSLQQSLFEMGKGLVEASPGVVEVRMSMPNRHHFTVDLSPFGLDNPNLVFKIQDRPYGLIEGCVLAQGAPAAGPAWEAYPLV
jgi:urate oxidase